MQCVGVDTAGEDFAGCRLYGVVCAGKACDGVEKDYHVVSTFHHAFCLFEDDVGDFDVLVGGFVESGGNDLGLDAALHVCDFLGTLVDEEYYDVYFGVVLDYRVRYVLEQYCLTGLWLCDDKSALAFAYRGEHVDYAA